MAVPQIANGDIIQVSFVQTCDEQRLLSVFHGQVSGLSGMSAYPDWAQALGIQLATEFEVAGQLYDWYAHCVTSWSMDAVRVQKISGTREVYFTAPVNKAGLIVNNNHTPNVAMSIEKKTWRPGRTGVGRVQVGGWDPTSITYGKWAAGDLSTAETTFEFFTFPYHATTVSSDITWGLWNANQMEPFVPIIQMVAMDTVRTMHRRTLRVGE